MKDKVFIDTNVLVYAHDIDAGRKQQIARSTLVELAEERTGALSMQVLQEFYVTALRKLAVSLAKEQARAIVEDFSHWCIETGPAEIRRAFQIEDEAHISFWDALIIASAIKAGASHILSEDMNHGQIIAGIEIRNPFLW